VVRIPVSATLSEQDEPPKAVVRNVRVAWRRPTLVNDPSRRVGLTNAMAESYPTMSHMAVAVPAALREVGFDVVEVHDLTSTEHVGAEYLLDMQEPTVAAFHPAEGSRITLVGSAYDVRVQYRGALRSPEQQPLGLVTGYGQETSRQLVMEPLFKHAAVGVFITVGTFVASIFMLGVVANFGMMSALASGGVDFGLCQRLGDPSLPSKTATIVVQDIGLCRRIVDNVLSTAFVFAVSITTGLVASVSGDLGDAVVNVGLAVAHTLGVDPLWRRMVKRAHDAAARDFARQVAERVLRPYIAPPSRLPDMPVPPAPFIQPRLPNASDGTPPPAASPFLPSQAPIPDPALSPPVLPAEPPPAKPRRR
jgi:hypothetical protein